MMLFLRGAFILLVGSVLSFYIISYQRILPVDSSNSLTLSQVVEVIVMTLGIALAVVAGDAFSKRKKLSALSGIFLGLVAGLVTAYALSFVVDLAALILAPDAINDALKGHPSPIYQLFQGVKVFIGLVTCYIGISMVIQTKDDFRFVLPYIEFAKQTRGNRPILLDTSVIIDGRIADIIDTKLFPGSLIVPKFVLNELQLVADSPDKLRRARGRRGLDVLQKLQDKPMAEVLINDSEPEGANVDQKLVALAQELEARVMTNDFNLNKIATLRGIDVINLNDLAKALRPVVLPGENMRVKIIKPGEAMSQGVGYLEDGTMVVIENGRQALGHDIDVIVTSTLQTSAGRMIFGRRLGSGEDNHNDHSNGSQLAGTPAPEEAPPTTNGSTAPRGPSPSAPRTPRRN